MPRIFKRGDYNLMKTNSKLNRNPMKLSQSKLPPNYQSFKQKFLSGNGFVENKWTLV